MGARITEDLTLTRRLTPENLIVFPDKPLRDQSSSKKASKFRAAKPARKAVRSA
jgi:hypothetical protein